LDLAGPVGYSPYRLRCALEKMIPVLKDWVLEEAAPGWAERLLRQCKRYLTVVECVPPVGSEVLG